MHQVIFSFPGCAEQSFLLCETSEVSHLVEIYAASFRFKASSLGHGCLLVTGEPKLRGGKGGFGKLLRSQKGKKIDNFDSCRDLSGRRIRAVKRDEEADKKVDDKEVSEPPSAAVVSVSLDEKYTKTLSEIRTKKESAVSAGLAENMKEGHIPTGEPVAKKMKSIKLFDEDSD